MSDIQVRMATEQELFHVSRIHAKSWKVGYQGIIPDGYLQNLKEDAWVLPFQTWLAEKSLDCAIAWQEDKAVGAVGFGRGREKEFAQCGEIVSCYVLPKYFREGIGKALMTYAIERLTEQGWSVCYLWVLAENARGRAFYEAMGFYPTGEYCTAEFDGKVVTELRYSKKIVK